MDFDQQLERYTSLIEQRLDFYMQNIQEKNLVRDAMAYSLMNAGKRVRPVLALGFCEMLGGDVTACLPYACAVEMIHTYSLIHDDLPCMDNDDMRRGKPSCHKQFGETYALLAGDALLNLAFEVISGRFEQVDAQTALLCAAVLSAASGIDGMIGGQTIDLLSENKKISLEQLKKLHALKTGALISAPCQIGTIAAQGSEADLQCAKAYAAAFGLQFQIVDDILDVTGTTEQLGKPIGSDDANHKSTYVSLLGLEQARESAETLKEEALTVLEAYGERAAFLKAFTLALTTRTK